MDILVLAESYRRFEHFIQNKSNIIKSCMKDGTAEDEDGNKYYFCPTDVAMCGRGFDKIIDIRVLSVNAVSRLRNLVDAEIEFGGITLTYSKRKETKNKNENLSY